MLLLSKQKDYSILLLAVPFLCRIGELFADVHTPATVQLEEGHAAAARKIWHLDELDAPEPLGRGTLDLVPEECLEIVQVSQLAGLTDTFSADESLVAIESQAVINIAEVSHEE